MSPLRASNLVIPSSFDIRISSFLSVQSVVSVALFLIRRHFRQLRREEAFLFFLV